MNATSVTSEFRLINKVREGAGDEIPHVLRDALVRVVDHVGIAQATVRAVKKVTFDEVLRHPLASEERKSLFSMSVENAERNGQREGP
jgi:hypothetical protein